MYLQLRGGKNNNKEKYLFRRNTCRDELEFDILHLCMNPKPSFSICNLIHKYQIRQGLSLNMVRKNQIIIYGYESLKLNLKFLNVQFRYQLSLVVSTIL